MWLSDVRLIVLSASLLLLGGCGFQPIYGPGPDTPGFQRQVWVEPGLVRRDFELRERLVERIGYAPREARYTLNFEIDVQETRLALEVGGQFSRNSLLGTAKYSVVDNTSGKTVHTGEVRSRAAYSATAETYPTQVAADDAEFRVARSLADLIANRIELTYPRWPE